MTAAPFEHRGKRASTNLGLWALEHGLFEHQPESVIAGGKVWAIAVFGSCTAKEGTFSAESIIQDLAGRFHEIDLATVESN